MFQIRRIELRDFLSHEHTVVAFDQGVTAIIGENGAGKTSIIDGILAAIIDFKRSSEELRGGKTSLIRYGRVNAEVVLDFMVNNRLYRVRRIISKYPGEDLHLLFEITGDKKKLIARGTKAVVEELSKIIELDTDTLKKIMVFRQGAIQRLLNTLSSSRKEKKELFDKLLGLHKYEKAREKLYEILRFTIKSPMGLEKRYTPTRESILNLENELEHAKIRVKELDNMIKEYRENIAKYEKDVLILNNEMKKLEEEIEAKENEIKHLSKLINEYNVLSEEKDRLEQKIQTINSRVNDILSSIKEFKSRMNELKDYEEILEPLMEIQNLLVKKQSLKQQLDNISDIINSLKRIESLRKENVEEKYSELKELENRLHEVSARIETLNKIIDKDVKKRENLIRRKEAVYKELTGIQELIKEDPLSLKKKIESLLEERARLQSRRDDIKKVIEELERAETQCPICKRPLTREHKEELLRRHRDELSYIEQQLTKINNEYLKLLQELNNVSALDDKRKSLQRDLDYIMERIKEIDTKIKENIEEKKQLEENMRNIIIKINQLREQHIEELYNELQRRIGETKGYTISDLEKLANLAEEKKKELNNLSKYYEKLVFRVKTILGIEVNTDNIEQILEDVKNKVREKKNLEDRLMKKEEEYNRLLGEKKSLEKKYQDVIDRLSEIDINKIKTKYTELEKYIKDLRSKYSELISNKAVLESKITELRNKIIELEDEVKKYTEFISEAEDKLGILKLAYYLRENVFHPDKIPSEIRSIAIKLVSREASRILSSFDLDYTVVNIDKNINITVSSANQTRKLTELSGGEQIAVILAIILALHKVIGRGKLGTLILDEPTIHLDMERRRKLVDIIKRFRGGEHIPQLIVITHHREVEQASDTVYEVVKTQGGVSRVKSYS